MIEITIKRCVGNLIKYERDNEGLRDRLDKPYRKKWTNAKFMLPSGNSKIEYFGYDATEDEILTAVSKKYSNFSFIITPLPTNTL